jgi:Tfp pilus assembly PilM family ATPase
MQWEARQHIPFDSNDVNVDCQVIEDSATGPTPVS